MFDKKGLIEIASSSLTEDEVMELALEHGAQDVRNEGDTFEITTDPSDFEAVRKAVEEKGWKIDMAEVTMIPQTTVRLDGKKAEQMLKMMDALDDHEDLQKVYANFDISEEEMLRASA
jgi:transcriptional/translational regulatory protein YebC/TACO1